MLNCKGRTLKKNLTDVNYILIDDDELIHMAWKLAAKKSATKLTCFYSVNEFLNCSSEFQKSVHIYVDSSLGEGISGEIESEKIKQAGFENIYLATGYAKEDIDLTDKDWIKDIHNKRPPF